MTLRAVTISFLAVTAAACLRADGQTGADASSADTPTGDLLADTHDAGQPTPDSGADPGAPSADATADAGPTDTAGPDVGLPTGPVYQSFIGDWTMAPGQESTRCVIKKLDNPTAINVAAIRTTLAPGSHHLIVYRVPDEPERPTPFDCTPFLDTLGSGSAPLMISQVAHETLQLPPGVALELEPHQTIRLEAHFLNYFPDDITAHADVEFFTTEETALEKADFLFYGTTSFLIGPQQELTSDWVHLDVPNNAKVFALTGHTHAFGTNVEITKSTSAADSGTPLYPMEETFQWDEAPIVRHDPPVTFAAGDGFRFRCSWNNTSDSFVYFGESADREMCFLWAYYYPSQGFRLCAEGLFDCPNDG